jgi:hypothetical protein
MSWPLALLIKPNPFPLLKNFTVPDVWPGHAASAGDAIAMALDSARTAKSDFLIIAMLLDA